MKWRISRAGERTKGCRRLVCCLRVTTTSTSRLFLPCCCQGKVKCAVKGGSKVGTNQNGTLIEEEEEQGREQLHTNEREREKESDDRSSPFPLSLSRSRSQTLLLFLSSYLLVSKCLCPCVRQSLFVSLSHLYLYLFICLFMCVGISLSLYSFPKHLQHLLCYKWLYLKCSLSETKSLSPLYSFSLSIRPSCSLYIT